MARKRKQRKKLVKKLAKKVIKKAKKEAKKKKKKKKKQKKLNADIEDTEVENTDLGDKTPGDEPSPSPLST